MTLNDKKVYVAGSGGMVGSAITRALTALDYRQLIVASRDDLDLIEQEAVERFFAKNKPEVVVLAAAKVGGIEANNKFRAEFIYNNLMIAANVIDAAHRHKVETLIFLGSSCIYPRLAEQPMREEALLTGPLEATNEPYSIAKIAGVKLCESYFRQYGSNFYSVMPTNLYGPNDNFDLDTSHVIPALIRKFHEARVNNDKEVIAWGTGTPMREFLHVDDLADAVVFLLENVDAAAIYAQNISHVNIGCGEDVTIKELAEMIGQITEFKGNIRFDTTKPDGAPRKMLDVSRLTAMGWRYRTSLEDGLTQTYDWFRNK